jgi:hypothetical protein
MGSLISNILKSSMELAMGDVHDTFARDLVCIKEANKVILSTDPNYNYLYKNVRGSVSSVQRKINSKTIKARVLYIGRQQEDLFDAQASAQLKVEKVAGEVRIKVGKVDYDYLKGTKRVEFDGRIFTMTSDERPHGLFSPQYYTFYLKPVD